MPKKKEIALPAYLERALLAFYSFFQYPNCVPPTYAQLGKALKRSDSFARNCMDKLAEEGRNYAVKSDETRYSPWRLTPKGIRLAKQLAKAKK